MQNKGKKQLENFPTYFSFPRSRYTIICFFLIFSVSCLHYQQTFPTFSFNLIILMHSIFFIMYVFVLCFNRSASCWRKFTVCIPISFMLKFVCFFVLCFKSFCAFSFPLFLIWIFYQRLVVSGWQVLGTAADSLKIDEPHRRSWVGCLCSIF